MEEPDDFTGQFPRIFVYVRPSVKGRMMKNLILIDENIPLGDTRYLCLEKFIHQNFIFHQSVL